MTDDNLVNFFIVGAPKCGSTSLFHALPRHPMITFGRAKEPHAFIGRLTLRGKTSMEAYQKLYDFESEFKVFGDASIMHLYSPDAAGKIAQYNPEAKILIMLREPEDFIVSYHHEQVYNGVENDASLDVCWDLSENRRQGKDIPVGCPDARLLDYTEIARFDEQVERFLDVFGKDQVRVGFLADIKKTPDLFIERLLEFLEVHQSPDILLEQHASAKTHKRSSVRNVIRVLSHPYVLSAWKKLRSVLGISGRLKLLHRIKVANTVSGEKAKIPPQLRETIRKHYADSWNRLNNLAKDVRLLS